MIGYKGFEKFSNEKEKSMKKIILSLLLIIG